MIYDRDFLKELDKNKFKEVFIKVEALTIDEYPIESIEGSISSTGNINIDGNSSVRRTFNLSLVTNKLNINDFYWGVKTKVKLYIGLKNNINKNYPDIIWFKQGTFILTSFSVSQSVNSFTINMSGKDKMCLLNGEIGGVITHASFDFGTEEYKDENGQVTLTKLPLKDIIKNAIHQYAGEPFHNIIINDLDETGIELLEYKGNSPLYLLRPKTAEHNNYTSVFLESSSSWYYKINDTSNWSSETVSLNQLNNIPNFSFEILNSTLAEGQKIGSLISTSSDGKNSYYIAKIEYGETVGYRETPLVYAGDLILTAGESITTLLDKIKEMLGDFEYFYDIDGKFIFQRQKIYENKSWNSLIESEDDIYAINSELASSLAYSFTDESLLQNVSNNPQIQNIKNDFIVWGNRKGINGNEIPIHARYAIDVKPTYYKQITVSDNDVSTYKSLTGGSLTAQTNPKEFTSDKYDWREIIYQMALDYRKYNHLDDFEIKVATANPEYPDGKTGYEQYYTDLLGFWRQLYNIDRDEIDGKDNEDKIIYTSENQYDDNFYVKQISRIPNNNVKNYNGEDLYVIVKSAPKVTLMKAIDWLNLFDIPCVYNWGDAVDEDPNGKQITNETILEKYELYYKLPGQEENNIEPPYVLNSINLTPLILYYQDPDNGQRVLLKEKFKDKIYIKNPYKTNSYLPALDLFEINGISKSLTKTELNKTNWVYYLNNKSKIIYLFGKDKDGKYNKKLTTISQILSNKDCKYSTVPNPTSDNDKKNLGTKDIICIEKLRDDLDYKEWYCKNENGKYVLFNGYYLTGACGKDKIIREGMISKQDLLVKKENYFYNLKRLITINRDQIYIKPDKEKEEYQLLIDYLPQIATMFLTKRYYDKTVENGKEKGLTRIPNGDSTWLNTYRFTGAYSALKKLNDNSISTDGLDNAGKIIEYNPPEGLNGKTIYKKVITEFGRPYLLYHTYIVTNEEGLRKCSYPSINSNVTFDGFYNKGDIITIEQYSDINDNYNGDWGRVVGTDYWVRLHNGNKKEYFAKRINRFPTKTYDYTRKSGKDNYLDSFSYYSKYNRYREDGWLKDIQDPSLLNFWFDFLDSSGDISKYSNKVIGNRPKVINDDKAKSIFYRDTPMILFVESIPGPNETKDGYTYIQIPKEMNTLFSISSKTKSCLDVITQNLHQYVYCQETINLTSIPIYYLEPNTKIFVYNDKNKINGEYIINQISVPLTHSGLMNINASALIQKFY